MSQPGRQGGARRRRRLVRGALLGCSLLLAVALGCAYLLFVPGPAERRRDESQRRVMIRETERLVALGRAGEVDEIVGLLLADEDPVNRNPRVRTVAEGKARWFSRRVRETRGAITVREVVYDHRPGWTWLWPDNWDAWVVIQIGASGSDPGRLETVLFYKEEGSPPRPLDLFDYGVLDQLDEETEKWPPDSGRSHPSTSTWGERR